MKREARSFESLKSLPVSVAILDASGEILSVNDTWKNFGRRNGLHIPSSGVGSNYLDYCGQGERRSAGLTKDLRALFSGRLDAVMRIYPCHSPRKHRWFLLVGVPLSFGKPTGAAIMHVNLTDMLPLMAGAIGAAHGGRARPTAGVDTLSSVIERSVSDTLAMQLNAELLRSRRSATRRKTSARHKPTAHAARVRLSESQMRVLRLLGEGKTNAEIAKALFRSPNTIKLHVSAILRRLNVRSRTEAALLASKLPDAVPSDASGVVPQKRTATVELAP